MFDASHFECFLHVVLVTLVEKIVVEMSSSLFAERVLIVSCLLQSSSLFSASSSFSIVFNFATSCPRQVLVDAAIPLSLV